MASCYLVQIDRQGQPPERVEMLGRTRQQVLLSAAELNPDAAQIKIFLRGEW